MLDYVGESNERGKLMKLIFKVNFLITHVLSSLRNKKYRWKKIIIGNICVYYLIAFECKGTWVENNNLITISEVNFGNDHLKKVFRIFQNSLLSPISTSFINISSVSFWSHVQFFLYLKCLTVVALPSRFTPDHEAAGGTKGGKRKEKRRRKRRQEIFSRE